MAYATVEEVKAFAKISYEDLGCLTEEEFDSFISDLISHAEAIVNDYCGQSWTTENVPATVKFVTIQLCANILHAVLQRKINPLIQVNDFTIRLITPEVFTSELKEILNHHRVLNISKG